MWLFIVVRWRWWDLSEWVENKARALMAKVNNG